MIERHWNPIRLSLLAATLAGGLVVLGKAIASPQATPSADRSAPNFALAQSVPLTGWQFQSSAPVAPELPPTDQPTQNRAEPEAITAQRYKYRQNTTELDAEVRYMLGDGNNSRFLFVYTPIRAANSNLQVRYQAGIGSYGVLAHQGRAYLSACINPQGESTVTDQQFIDNSYRHDLRVGRVLPWILGQQPLLDRRCLWTLMSVPLPSEKLTDTATVEAAFKTLEAAWVPWYQWWKSNYPPA